MKYTLYIEGEAYATENKLSNLIEEGEEIAAEENLTDMIIEDEDGIQVWAPIVRRDEQDTPLYTTNDDYQDRRSINPYE